LTESKPSARADAISANTCSAGWTRCTAFCTSGSKSCTPKLRRLKPRSASACSRSRVTVRGSISIERSPPGASAKLRRSMAISSPSSRRQEGGRAAAQVQLAHGCAVARADLRGVQLHLAQAR
jgi:hypothetical protein